MGSKTFRRTLVASALITALGISEAPEAAIFSGSFDPFDFAGTFQLQFNNSCLAADGWYTATACNAVLLSASAAVTSTPPETYNGTLTFPSVGPPTVEGLYIYGGTLNSFDTDLIHFATAAPPPINPTDFWIQFASGQAPCTDCYSFAVAALPPDQLDRGVYLYAGNGTPPNEPNAMAQYLTITRIDNPVPEPGTLGLLLGGAAAALVGRRRRNNVDTS